MLIHNNIVGFIMQNNWSLCLVPAVYIMKSWHQVDQLMAINYMIKDSYSDCMKSFITYSE